MTRDVVGKPKVVETPERFTELAEEYISKCEDNDKTMTITGLALHLGFASIQSIHDYAKYDGFEFAVKRARLYIEHSYELKLSGNNVAGPIFALKQFGWSDKQELALSGNVSHKDESEAVLLALKNKHKEL